MSLLRRKKDPVIDYFVPYFYTMGSWWINEKSNGFVGCRRIAKAEVPENYLT